MESSSIVKITNLLNFTRQDFDVLEQKLMILILEELRSKQGFNIDIEPNKNLELSFRYSQFEQNTSSIRFKELAEKILHKHIYYETSPNKWSYLVPFIKASYNEGTFLIKINEDVVKYFLELAKGYTNLNKRYIFALNSTHAIRMYELLSSFVKEKTWTVKLSLLRDLLNIGNKYKNFTDFQKSVLQYCQKELDEHCELNFTWEVAEKQRKKVTALTFHIQSKQQKEKVELKEEIRQTIDFVAKLSPVEIARTYNLITSKYNLSTKQADYIFSDNKLLNEFIRVDLIIESMIEKGKPPKDRTKYLAKSLGLDKVKF